MLAEIQIKKLKARAVIGVNKDEREKEQDIYITVRFEYDAQKAISMDDIGLAPDYNSIRQKIINKIKNTRFGLLEKLTKHILDAVMDNPQIQAASVRVDKPYALECCSSVSCTLSADRKKDVL